MRALSLFQPWASLMACGAKSIETRSRRVLGGYRGPLLIHAGLNWSPGFADVCLTPAYRAALGAAGFDPVHAKECLPFGAIVGKVEVVGTWAVEDARLSCGDVSGWGVIPEPGSLFAIDGTLCVGADEMPFGDYRPGRFLIATRRPQVMTRPFKTRGYQGLFNIPDEVILPWLQQYPLNPPDPPETEPTAEAMPMSAA